MYLWAEKPSDAEQLLDGRNRLDALAKLNLLGVELTPLYFAASRSFRTGSSAGADWIVSDIMSLQT
jgi:hypothetical protein